MNIIGIDLGGTKIALAKYDSDSWEKLDESQIPTKSQKGINAIVDQLVQLIETHSDDQTEAIGVGVPGPTLNGIVERFPNIPGAEKFDLKSSIDKKLSAAADHRASSINHKPLTVTIENDSNCFVVGAWQLGKDRDKQNIIGLTIGTGVGGGIIQGGQLVRGKDGSAGEFGHNIIRDNLELEELISGPALKKRWREQYQEEKTGREIADLAENDDRKALSFLASIAEDLGTALVNIILDYNPEIILIGGSASTPLPFYLPTIKKIIAEKCFPESQNTPITKIENKDSATFGAAWLAKNKG